MNSIQQKKNEKHGKLNYKMKEIDESIKENHSYNNCVCGNGRILTEKASRIIHDCSRIPRNIENHGGVSVNEGMVCDGSHGGESEWYDRDWFALVWIVSSY